MLITRNWTARKLTEFRRICQGHRWPAQIGKNAAGYQENGHHAGNDPLPLSPLLRIRPRTGGGGRRHDDGPGQVVANSLAPAGKTRDQRAEKVECRQPVNHPQQVSNQNPPAGGPAPIEAGDPYTDGGLPQGLSKELFQEQVVTDRPNPKPEAVDRHCARVRGEPSGRGRIHDNVRNPHGAERKVDQGLEHRDDDQVEDRGAGPPPDTGRWKR